MRARALGEWGPGPARLYQPDKARAPRPQHTPRPVRAVRRHWLSATVLAAGVVVAVLVGKAFVGQELRLRELRAEAEMVSGQLENTRKLNSALKQEMLRLNSLDYVETVARQQLGLVKPGEIQYMALDGSGNSR